MSHRRKLERSKRSKGFIRKCREAQLWVDLLKPQLDRYIEKNNLAVTVELRRKSVYVIVKVTPPGEEMDLHVNLFGNANAVDAIIDTITEASARAKVDIPDAPKEEPEADRNQLPIEPSGGLRGSSLHLAESEREREESSPGG